MGYIDKIKKDGVIYDIKGKNSGGGDTPAGTVSNVIEFMPEEDTEYQILENIYTTPIITAIKDGEMLCLPVMNKFDNFPEAFNGGLPGCLENYSLFFQCFEATSENSANALLFVLCFGKLLCRIQTTVAIETDTEDPQVVVGEATCLGLTQDVIDSVIDSLKDTVSSISAIYGSNDPYVDESVPGSIVREYLESLDPEAVEKLIGESQDE